MMAPSQLYRIDSANFRYGRTTVFDNLCFHLEKGMFYGLIGANGSGKSTLIELLMGIRSLHSGTIHYKEKPLFTYRRRELARQLALVPQYIAIGFDFSVRDIVLMGRHPHIPRFCHPSEKDQQAVDNALRQLDIEHLKDRPVSNLSGGEKQRVVVARSLAQDTETLLLDEATSNLDIEHTIEIMRVLRKKVQIGGATIIAAIHDLNLAAAFCDELIVLDNRDIYTFGPVRKVLTPDLLENVFSVKGSVLQRPDHPRVEFEMLP